MAKVKFDAQQLKDDIAVQIRIARAIRNITRRELSLRSGVSPGQLALIEHGKVNPRMGTIGKVMASMNFSLNFDILPNLPTPITALDKTVKSL